MVRVSVKMKRSKRTVLNENTLEEAADFRLEKGLTLHKAEATVVLKWPHQNTDLNPIKDPSTPKINPTFRDFYL